jgi:hypothetical protein
MPRERDPTIDRALEANNGRPVPAVSPLQELLDDARDLGTDAGPLGVKPPPDPHVLVDPARWPDTMVLCATHTRPVWKLCGHPGVMFKTLALSRDPGALRALAVGNGYALDAGELWVEHFTGVEIFKRQKGTEGGQQG